MALNKNSNGFTFGFAIAMVVIVGTLLASVSMSLKPLQEANERVKKMMDIVGAIDPENEINPTRDTAEELYGKYVKETKIISGKDMANGDPFAIDVRKEYKDKTLAVADRNYPLYICEKEGKKYYVIPMVGTGLWGPIWGYVALEEDLKTIYGAKYDHKGETPGLGAEIKTEAFQKLFRGEYITKNGEFSKMVIVKDGSGGGINGKVDGITGGTITSVGVEEMVNRTMEIYSDYFKQQNK